MIIALGGVWGNKLEFPPFTATVSGSQVWNTGEIPRIIASPWLPQRNAQRANMVTSRSYRPAEMLLTESRMSDGRDQTGVANCPASRSANGQRFWESRRSEIPQG